MLTEAQTKEALQALLPALSNSTHQVEGRLGYSLRPHCSSRMSLSPLYTFSLQNYTEWLQELKEKSLELLKQPPVNTELPSVSMA